MALAWEPRAKLEQRASFALLATALRGPAWAFAEPASVASALAGHYRPPLPGLGGRIAPPSAAPGELAPALRQARLELEARGYRLAPEGAREADLVLLVSLSATPDGRLQRAAVHLGGPLDDRFRPDLVGLAAVVPQGPDACPVRAEELIAALLELVPEREAPP